MTKKRQYFMYGTLVSYDNYLEIKTGNTIEELVENHDDIQGIFIGRNGDFVIVGVVLDAVNMGKDEGMIVPELTSEEESLTRVTIEEKFGITGEFHYYFIRK